MHCVRGGGFLGPVGGCGGGYVEGVWRVWGDRAYEDDCVTIVYMHVALPHVWDVHTKRYAVTKK